MVITASLAGACTGMLAGDGLLYFLFNERKFVLDSFTLTVLPVMTITISILAASIDILMSQREKYKTQAAVLSEKNKMKNLVFKEKGSLIKVNPAEIVYVASSAKKTVIHSIKQDIEIGNLMKAVEAILPAKIFLRIHKQFIINTDYISRFVHIKSGLYEVLLNDDDETVLPVGRKYSSRVRNFMSSHMHVPGP
jgi:DNA-binding LytR/AlgR family response regulator